MIAQISEAEISDCDDRDVSETFGADDHRPPKWYPTVKQQGDLFIFGVGD